MIWGVSKHSKQQCHVAFLLSSTRRRFRLLLVAFSWLLIRAPKRQCLWLFHGLFVGSRQALSLSLNREEACTCSSSTTTEKKIIQQTPAKIPGSCILNFFDKPGMSYLPPSSLLCQCGPDCCWRRKVPHGRRFVYAFFCPNEVGRRLGLLLLLWAASWHSCTPGNRHSQAHSSRSLDWQQGT